MNKRSIFLGQKKKFSILKSETLFIHKVYNNKIQNIDKVEYS